VVRGQVEVATTEGVIQSIELVPPNPPVPDDALRAIAEADWVFLGPGSWFSSVMPHLRVRAIHDALVRTAAQVVVVLNLAEQAGETGGFGPADHLAVLAEHAPELRVHTVLADPSMEDLAGLREVTEALGARLVIDDVAKADGSAQHDVSKLAAAYARIVNG
jgi:uncharacterized cofD-like protein